MAAKDSRRLVIDASVARASGGEDATFPTSKNCRAFLEAVRTICHRVVMTPKVGEEWKKHHSKFARLWRVSMEARKKVEHLATVAKEDLRKKVEEVVSREKDLEAILKDFHLVEAALVTDQVVISLDERVRNLLAAVSQIAKELKKVVWINPDSAADEPLDWLEQGAKLQKHRQLGFTEKQD